MNPLQEVALNSVALIDQRLAELQREVSEIENDYSTSMQEEIPMPSPIPLPVTYTAENLGA
jgi:hypothetical protein